MSSMFRTSVHECVDESLRTRQPLFVYLSNGSLKSGEFINKYLPATSIELVDKIKTNFIPLKLEENTVDYGFFVQIFSQVSVPSFHVVSHGQVLDVILPDVTVDDFVARIDRIVALNPRSSATNSPAPSSSNSGAVNGPASGHVNSSMNEASTTQPNTQKNTQPEESTNTASSNRTTPNPPTRNNSQSTRGSTSPEKSASPSASSLIKSTAREEAIRKHKAEVRESRRQQKQEKDRLRALINADKKERMSQRRQYTTKEQEAPKKTLSPGICSLSIKLFDGSNLKHDFDADKTLNDVRNWLDKETEIIRDTDSIPSFATNTGPNHYVFHRPSFPRTTFTDEQEFKKLSELDLCPRSALILKPIFNETVSSFPKEKGGIWKSVGGAMSKVGNALYSFFDYGVDDPHHYQEEHESDDYDEPRGPVSDARSTAIDETLTEETISEVTAPLISINENRSVSSLINIDEYRPRSANMLRSQFHSPIVQPQENDAFVSPFVSRSSTPINRLHTVRTLDDSKDDINTYNGNSVNLNSNDNNDSD